MNGNQISNLDYWQSKPSTSTTYGFGDVEMNLINNASYDCCMANRYDYDNGFGQRISCGLSADGEFKYSECCVEGFMIKTIIP